jgi:hypothetical protein
MIVAKEHFTGSSRHALRGGAVTEKRGCGYWMWTGPEFHFGGAPEQGLASALPSGLASRPSHHLTALMRQRLRDEAEATRFHGLQSDVTVEPPQIEIGGPGGAPIGPDFGPDIHQATVLRHPGIGSLRGVGPLTITGRAG